MPIYEYICQNCHRRARIFMSYAEYDHSQPACPHCSSTNLKRKVGRVAVARSEEARLDRLMDDESLAGMEDDPRAMGRFMREMSREMGEDLGDEFEEVAGRLEKGESPESIEASMPELGSGDAGGFDDDY
jgi:putative FmdB family regulatory protein